MATEDSQAHAQIQNLWFEIISKKLLVEIHLNTKQNLLYPRIEVERTQNERTKSLYR